MGCDIHIQIERCEAGQWKRVVWADDYDREFYKSIPADALSMPNAFDNRNYDLFGVLADVRNGTWGEEVPVIDLPRGLPRDMDGPDHAEDGDDENEPSRWLGDHSHSWLTVAELEAYPWDVTIRKRGWVSHEQAEKFRADGVRPDSYSASGNHGEYIYWDESVRSMVGDWPAKILPLLKALGEPQDVRLVFGFDS